MIMCCASEYRHDVNELAAFKAGRESMVSGIHGRPTLADYALQ
jgi:hypothetical protein